MAPDIAELHGELTPRLAGDLGRYIAAHQQFVAAIEARKRRGEDYRMTRKGPRIWPEVIAEYKACRTSLYLAQQLGCTPLARMRILRRRQAQRR